MEDTTSNTDTAIAKAITDLSEAIWAMTDKPTRTRLTVMTASTGGELLLEWNPKISDEEFLTYLSKELKRREMALKGCQAQNLENGIVPKAAK
jgi:hypothetical protein